MMVLPPEGARSAANPAGPFAFAFAFATVRERHGPSFEAGAQGVFARPSEAAEPSTVTLSSIPRDGTVGAAPGPSL